MEGKRDEVGNGLGEGETFRWREVKKALRRDPESDEEEEKEEGNEFWSR